MHFTDKDGWTAGEAPYTTRTPEDEAYIAKLEEQIETAALHPGYIAKAGPADQQAFELANQLAKLHADFAKISQENENLRATLRELEREAHSLGYALGRKLQGNW